MKGKDEIKDLFSEKLGNFEAQVRPDMWSNIATQIGGTTTVATTGLSIFTKTIIGLGIGAAVITTVLLVAPSDTSTRADQPKKKITSEAIKEKNAPNTSTNDAEVDEIVTPPKKEAVNQVDQPNENNASLEIDENLTFKSTPTNSPFTIKSQEKNAPTEKVVQETTQPAMTETVEKTIGIKEEKPTENTSQESEPTVKEETIIKPTYTLEKLPNIFTPNGDGNNDILSVSSEGLLDFTVVVLDDKQNVVFESNNPNFKWDGINKYGEKVKAGTYGYYIIAKDSNGNKVNKFSALQIVF